MRELKTIEMHTCGEPARIVIDGMPELRGSTMQEKEQDMREHYDNLRTAIIQEPRGHQNMFGIVLTKPCRPEADFGVLFLNGVGYEGMCGHGTICLATAAVNEGWIPLTEPETVMKIDTVTGLVPVRIRVKDGRAQSVTLQNVPSFVYSTDQEIHTDHHGTVRADIVFGGNVFALINADEQGIPMTLESLRPLTNLAMDVLAHVNDDASFRHPELPAFRKIEFMLLYSDKDAAPGYSGRNCIIFEGEQTDRSPCGTGVSARVADLVHRGRLAIGEETAQYNLMGQRFTGKAVAAEQVGGFPAVRVEISGTAYKTGSCTFLIDENDPLTYGFPFHA